MSCQLPQERIDATIDFHGHSCPGLAIGIRAAELALRELNHPKDSEVVAIVETDMCGVDALQFLLGTTYGKGNLIHRDYGKMAFSFFRTDCEMGFRALLRRDCRQGLDDKMAQLRSQPENAETKNLLLGLRKKLLVRFMGLSLEELFICEALTQNRPRPPRVLESLDCTHCGEQVMESRTRRFAGEVLCIPCFAKVEQKF